MVRYNGEDVETVPGHLVYSRRKHVDVWSVECEWCLETHTFWPYAGPQRRWCEAPRTGIFRTPCGFLIQIEETAPIVF